MTSFLNVHFLFRCFVTIKQFMFIKVTEISEVSYTSEACQDLEEARRNGSFCDVTLLIGPQRHPIKAHRLILASNSDYFKAMFTSDFKEGTQSEIELPKMDVSVMESLVEFAYTGKTKVTDHNIEEMVTAANFYRMSRILKKCLEYIMVRIDHSNCIEILEFAEHISNNCLKHSAYRFIIQEFEAISSKNLDIVDMSTALLLEIIGDPATSIHPDPTENEERLFQLGWNHLHAKSEGALEKCLPGLLKAVHLPRVSDKFLEDLTRKVGYDQTVNTLLEVAKHIKAANQPDGGKTVQWAMNRFRKSGTLSVTCDRLGNDLSQYWDGVPALINGLPLNLILQKESHTDDNGPPMDYLAVGIQCLQDINSTSIPCKIYFNILASKNGIKRQENTRKCKYTFDSHTVDNVIWLPKFMKVTEVLANHYNNENDFCTVSAQINLESDMIYHQGTF